MANKIVKFSEQLDAHGAELTSEVLMELEAAKAKGQENAEPGNEPVEEPRGFVAKEMLRHPQQWQDLRRWTPIHRGF